MTLIPAAVVNEKALARRIKDHVIGSRHEFFAVVQPGFEEAAGRELRALGINDFNSPASGGITFFGETERRLPGKSWRRHAEPPVAAPVPFQSLWFRRIQPQNVRLPLGTVLERQSHDHLCHQHRPLPFVAQRPFAGGKPGGHPGAPGGFRPAGFSGSKKSRRRQRERTGHFHSPRTRPLPGQPGQQRRTSHTGVVTTNSAPRRRSGKHWPAPS